MSDTHGQKPHLDNPDDFRAVLASYRPSDETIRTLRSSRVLLLVAPTSSGRNTIINELVKTGQYAYVVSHTTRPKRVNNGVWEQDGVEYWFRKEADLLQELQDGKFIEAAIIHNQQVSGVAIREFKAAHMQNKISTTDIEIEGAINMHKLAPNVQLVFVLPPGFEEWLRRFMLRGPVGREEIRNRIGSAPIEIERALQYPGFHFIINDQLEEAIQEVHAIAMGTHPLDQEVEKNARNHAEQLVIDSRLYLESL